MLSIRKGQSIAEYAVLLSLVIAAAVAMQVYVKRGVQAKIKSGTDAYTSVAEKIDAAGGKTVEFKALAQYEPYYQESTYDRYQENIEQEHMDKGKVIKEKVSDISAAATGGSDKQIVGKTTRARRDALWE